MKVFSKPKEKRAICVALRETASVCGCFSWGAVRLKQRGRATFSEMVVSLNVKGPKELRLSMNWYYGLDGL